MLGPGEPIGMYHWEANQEDFLLVSGEGILLIEGEERPLRQWDFVHCPPHAKHMILGAGDTGCVVFAVGARGNEGDGVWGGYSVDDVARRHGVSVDEETSDARIAYASFAPSTPAQYGGWLP